MHEISEYSYALLNSAIVYLRQRCLVETLWYTQVQASEGPAFSCCNIKNDLTVSVLRPYDN